MNITASEIEGSQLKAARTAGKICSDMKGQKIYGSLKSNIDELKTQLADAENTLRHCNPKLFEKFFFAEAKNYSYDGVKKKFDDWMYDYQMILNKNSLKRASLLA